MHKYNMMKKKRFLFNRLSIQQRLPVLICILLLFAIVIYGLANYYSLKKAALIIGKEHLTSLTSQMNGSLGRSAQTLKKIENSTAAQTSVIQYLKSGGKEFRPEASDALDKIARDTTWVSLELINAQFQPVLRSGKSTINIPGNIKDIVSSLHVGTDSAKVGKIYKIKNGVYFPIIAAVSDKKRVIGYIITWKSLLVTPKAVEEFSQVVGIGADFYVGNTDGSLWTNLIRPLPGVPFKINRINEIISYAGSNGDAMIVSPQLIPNTPWVIAIAFSERNILKGITTFVNWIIVIGVVLMGIGIFAAWVMSGNIIRPLKELTEAATAITQGNYTASVSMDFNQNDEIGKLAGAFNSMTAQIYQMHNDLENKVIERTSQLENVNKELEAFSYSVSHDLRTPLRAINGYSIMFKEDYGDVLDAEGNRILQNIILNAKMMGKLIDDLLSFSRLGKKDLTLTTINMQQMAESVVNDLLQHEPEDKYRIIITSLPPVETDAVMIKQVFLNLISNAIKYSAKKDTPEIEIGFKDEETQITYYIKDNGAGFDMAYANKLFGVFQRLHSQEEFEGTGVGLALVKRIIDKHKGEIWAEGEERNGATFYFSLPKK
ncbi:ATP-binding protein [Mucilaginibacter sp.]|uniref:sensor histidine kinase n=1 Tax=Mucilaginibacter sp. TaxID=1882438 RepID=UPI0026372B92|nr:ATP-binding protein [Mucilaginibacter sp.]